MAYETQQENFIRPLSVIGESASAALNPRAVWKNLVKRVDMPTTTQTHEEKKEGKLVRSVLAENGTYSYVAGSEYYETNTLLNAIKSVVISKITVEAKRFNQVSPDEVIGRAQGNALAVGIEEDIAAVASTFTSFITAAAELTIEEILAGALDVSIASEGSSLEGRNLVGVFHPKALFEAGVTNVFGSTSPVHGAAGSSVNALLETAGGRRGMNGFRASVGGVDLFETNVIDDDGTNFQNLVFDPELAILGMWDDEVSLLDQLDIESFRDRKASYLFSDFAAHRDECGCRVLSAVA